MLILYCLIEKKGSHVNLQDANDQPLQLADTATAAQTPTLSQTQSSSSTSPILRVKWLATLRTSTLVLLLLILN